jgi:hypothetical protein
VLNQHSECKDTPTIVPRDWMERQSWAFQAGLLIGVTHMLFMLMSIIYIISHHEGQWHMFWIVSGYIDYPVSLLLPKAILPALSHFFVQGDPYLASARSLQIFLIFSLFHVLVGSAWYFALPVLIHKISKKITTTTTGALTAAAMIIIPIPSHWLQLLRFVGGDTKQTTIGFNSVLPAVWIILFIWLFLVSVKRKAMLWLLCLLPPVFYYLILDLYYYMLRAGR